MSTGSISLDILLNKILTDAISGGNESIRAIQKRYPSLSEKEAHEILVLMSKIFSLSVQSSCPDIRMCSSCRD